MLIFQGANRSQYQYSREVVQNINLGLARGESDLYQTKWWDYRISDREDGDFISMHPMEATHLFAHHYAIAYKRAFSIRKSKLKSVHVNPIKQIFLANTTRVVNAIWSARKKADEYGIPYDFWCQKAMAYAELMDWPHLPGPNQLYGTKSIHSDLANYISVVDFIVAEWKVKITDNIVTADSPYYVTDFIKRPISQDQRDHMMYLVSQITKSPNKAILISDFVFRRRMLFPESIIVYFGKEEGESLLGRARRLYE